MPMAVKAVKAVKVVKAVLSLVGETVMGTVVEGEVEAQKVEEEGPEVH